MLLAVLLFCLSTKATLGLAQLTSTVSLPSATLIADARVSAATGALTAAVIAVSDCESTFVIQCFNNPICQLHGPATVTQGPSHYESQWVYNTPGGTASHSESCTFSNVPGIANCFGYTTITESSASVISSAFTVAVQAYQVPLTQGVDSLATPWSLCTPMPTASVTAAAVQTGQQSKGLSTGAQAGIGVGAGVGGAIILGAALFFLLRRRKRQQPHFEQAGPQMTEATAGGEAAQEKKTESTKAYHYEMPQVTSPQQLYGSESAERHELPGATT